MMPAVGPLATLQQEQGDAYANPVVPWMTGIQQLGFEARNTDFMRDFRVLQAEPWNPMYKFLAWFQNLKALHLITLPVPGDPDSIEFGDEAAGGEDSDDGDGGGDAEAEEQSSLSLEKVR